VFRTAIPYFLTCAFLSVVLAGGALAIWLGITWKTGTFLSDSSQAVSIAPFLLVALCSPLIIFGLGAVKLYARAASRGVSEGRRLVGSLVFAASPLLMAGLVFLAPLARSALHRLNDVLDTERSRSLHDSVRFKELNELKLAMEDFYEQRPGSWIGEPRTVYVSVPDTDPACENLGLPSLPEGWRYRCVPEERTHKSDGTGWLPVDFTLKSGQHYIPFFSARLPVDPVNTVKSGLFYQLRVDEQGGWILQARFASREYSERTWNRPGPRDNPAFRIEGKSLSLIAALLLPLFGLGE
jgi:hypothetical protein